MRTDKHESKLIQTWEKKDWSATPTEPRKTLQRSHITVNGQTLHSVEKCTYQGSILSRSANIDDEVNNRIANVSAAFRRLRANVWERRGLDQLYYKTESLQSRNNHPLLYAIETWAV